MSGVVEKEVIDLIEQFKKFKVDLTELYNIESARLVNNTFEHSLLLYFKGVAMPMKISAPGSTDLVVEIYRNIQVLGGCAGHIDLGKLQQIEKE
jgi:hypothetical protein